MDFFIDNPETEKKYQEILQRIRMMKNGMVSENMVQRGIRYKTNWGASIVDIRQLSAEITPGHLLAMKLWNRKWRETMILATLVDVPGEVTAEQMDYWTKSFENIEIAEQAVSNLWVRTPFAFIKALEWCRGKKHLVRYTGVQLIGRLAFTAKNDPDEMFDMFFSELKTLAKDTQLSAVLQRSLLLVGNRSPELREQVRAFSDELLNSDSPTAKMLGNELIECFRAINP